MKGIAISGIKGGTGKTTISHALALGAAWNNIPAYFCHTDNREPIVTRNRPYSYYDARNTDTLHYLIKAAIDLEGIFIIDGGGNRQDFDNWISSAVDLIVIPVTPDPEDIQESLRHCDAMYKSGAEKVVFLINRYPSNIYEQQFIKKYINRLPEDMIIGKINEVKSIKRLRESDYEDFKTPNTKVNNLSRLVYKIINSAI